MMQASGFSSNSLTPLWRRRSTPQPQLLGRSKPRPQSYLRPQRVADHGFPGGGPRDAPCGADCGRSARRLRRQDGQEGPLLMRHRRAVTKLGGPSPGTGLSLLGFDGPSHPKSPSVKSGVPQSPANGTVTKPVPQPLHPRGLLERRPLQPRGTRPDSPTSPLPSPTAAMGFPYVSQGAGSLSGGMAGGP